jgi:purine-binding chemotaxis protein CheW
MSESHPTTPVDDSDDELKQALAAFGDDALSLLEGDDFDEISAEMTESLGVQTPSTCSVTPECLLDQFESDDDVSPLIRYMKKLNKAIYGNALAARQNRCHGSVAQSHSASSVPRFIVFEVAERQLAANLDDVLEIARYPKVTQLPRTPSWLRGVTQLRGQILSVTDLRDLLQLPCKRPAIGEKIIVIHSKKLAASTAIVVDRVVGIRSPGDKNELANTAGLDPPIASIASGIAMFDHETTVIIDPDQLLECAEPAGIAP